MIWSISLTLTSIAIQQNQRGVNESEREFLIRTGKITPFAKLSGLEKTSQQNGKCDQID
jgi:hypothetical protein